MIRFIVVLALLFAGSVAVAQDCSSGQCGSAAGYAARLNGSRLFRHDTSWGGAEVIYRSSGVATEAEARKWWMNSPPHRKLLVSGAIQDVACVGGVCVGRSVGAVSNNMIQPARQGFQAGKAISHRTPLKRIRNHFNRCR